MGSAGVFNYQVIASRLSSHVGLRFPIFPFLLILPSARDPASGDVHCQQGYSRVLESQLQVEIGEYSKYHATLLVHTVSFLDQRIVSSKADVRELTSGGLRPTTLPP